MTSIVARKPRPGSVAAIAIALSSTACVRQLPPAPTPAPIVPQVEASAPLAEGHGRLVVDVVDGATPITRVRVAPQRNELGPGRVSYRFSEVEELLCPATPCVVDVPAGNLLLGFPVRGGGHSTERELVHVDGATVYRRSLSVLEERGGALQTWGIVGASVGSAAAITGAVLLPVGLDEDRDGLANAGLITLGAGVALVAFGVWALRREADLYRPGSANHYPLAPDAR